MNPAQGETVSPKRETKLGTAFFLWGDLHRKHESVETALRTRLETSFSRWIGQEESLTLAGADYTTHVGQRLSLLKQQVLACSEPSDVVLIGQSSGARVATMLSLGIKAAATIALGYPFRHPQKAIEVGRFQHLHRVSVPTLFIQGVIDRFGGVNITEDYPLSSAITVKFVNAEHSLQLQPAEWDDVAQSIKDFCVSSFVDAKDALFDENYYLRAYPDVAAAVQGGHSESGRDHYRKVGWRKKRRFRLIPLNAVRA